MNNNITNGEYNTFFPTLIIFLLAIALIWTYIRIIAYFVGFIKQ